MEILQLENITEMKISPEGPNDRFELAEKRLKSISVSRKSLRQGKSKQEPCNYEKTNLVHQRTGHRGTEINVSGPTDGKT